MTLVYAFWRRGVITKQGKNNTCTLRVISQLAAGVAKAQKANTTPVQPNAPALYTIGTDESGYDPFVFSGQLTIGARP